MSRIIPENLNSFPYTASFNRTSGTVTGSGISLLNPPDSFTILNGNISGNEITLTPEFNNGGYIGSQVNTGVIDCAAGSMGGTWIHTGGFGNHVHE
jgi:hypothetical protein